MPLVERMREEVPEEAEALQPLFVDDVTPVGPAGPNARCLKFLCDNDPRYGYFPEPEKPFYVCKGEDEGVAKMAFTGFGFGADVLKFVRGHRYLGSYIGSGTLKEDYILNDKVTTWVLATAHKRPKTLSPRDNDQHPPTHHQPFPSPPAK